MSGFSCRESAIDQLTVLLATSPWTSAFMGLSTSAVTCSPATVAGDLVGGELTVGGYSRKALAGWLTPTLDALGRAISSAAAVTFHNTSPSDTPAIYTWFFINQSTGRLLAAGNFDVPFVIPAGDALPYTTVPFNGNLPQ